MTESMSVVMRQTDSICIYDSRHECGREADRHECGREADRHNR